MSGKDLKQSKGAAILRVESLPQSISNLEFNATPKNKPHQKKKH